MRLFEIAEQYREVDAMLDETGGEITPGIQFALDALGGQLADKVDGIGSLIREATAEAAAFKEEADALRAKGKACENRADRLKGFLLHHLKAIGVEKVKGARFSARVAKAGTPTIRWTESVEDIPSRYRRVRIELDGKAAQDDFKEDGSLPPGFSVDYTEYLAIK